MTQTRINAVLHRISDLFADVEDENKRAERVVVSGPTLAFLSSEREFMDGASLESRPDWEESGLRGTFWNAQIYVNENVPDDHVVVLPEGDQTVITRTWAPAPGQLSPL
jgi:hypothetical protein